MNSGGSRREKKQQRVDWRGRQKAVPEQQVGGVHRRRGSGLRRWLLISILTIFLVLLLVPLVKLLLTKPLVTPMFAWAFTEYAAPLAPNSLVVEDLQRFQLTWKQTDSGLTGKREIEFQDESRAQPWLSQERIVGHFTQKMQGAVPGGPDGNVVLLYLSAHGVVDAQGRACLLVDPRASSSTAALWPVQGDPASHFLYVPVLEIFRGCRAGLEKSVKLVVFLDAHKLTSVWPLGLIDNPFAEALEVELQAAKEDFENVLLIGSAGKGQAAWCFPERGHSAFAEAVRQALAGLADGHGGSRPDRVIDSLELVQSILDRVRSMAAGWRDAEQVPFVYPLQEPGGQPFPISYCRASSATSDVLDSDPPSSDMPSGDQHVDFWRTHDKLAPWSKDGSPLSPERWLDFIAYQQGLERLEQLGEAGEAYRGETVSLLPQVKALQNELERHATETVEVFNVAGLGMGKDDLEKNLADIRNFWSAPLDKRPESRERIEALSYEARARCIWDHLVQHGLTSDDAIVESLRLAPNPADRPEFVEMRALRMWREDGHLPAGVRSQTGLIHQAVVTRDRAEKAIALQDARSIIFVRPLILIGDRLRREKDDGLFLERTTVADYDGVKAHYERAVELGRSLNRMFHALDRVYLELPHFARFYARVGESNRLLALKRTAASATALTDKLRILHETTEQVAVAESDMDEYVGRFDEVVAQANSIVEELNEWHEDLNARIVRVTGLRAETNAATVREAIELAQTPLAGGQRIALRRKWWGITPKLAQPALDLKARSRVASEPSVAWDSQLLLPRDDLQRPLDDAEGRPRQAGGLAFQLRGNVWQFLQKYFTSDPASDQDEMPNILDASVTFEAEMQARRLAPLIAWPVDRRSATVARKFEQSDPIRVHARWQRGRHSVLRADRSIEDFYGNDSAGAAEQLYFAVLADRYLRQVDPQCDALALDTRHRLEILRPAAGRWLECQLSGVSTGQGGLAGPTVVILPGDREFPLKLETSSPRAIPAGTASLTIDQNGSPVPLRPAGSAPDAGKATTAPLAIPAATASGLELIVNSPLTDGRPVDLGAVFAYRNHVQEKRFGVMSPEQSQVAAWVRPAEQKASIIVEADYKDPGTACFLLDCSKSMQNGKLDTAIEASNEVLASLTGLHNHLSLWLLGHRIDDRSRIWSPNSYRRTPEGKWVRQPTKPRGVDISNDVDLAWRSGDQFGFGEVLNSERLRPTGQTPLHYAMVRAIREELKNGPEPRRLVVLTDGKDSSSDVFAGLGLTVTTTKNVEAEFKKVPNVHVYFLVDARLKESDPNAMKTIEALSKQLGGEVRLIGLGEKDLDKLVCRLNVAFGNFHWNAIKSDSTSPTLRSIRVNAPAQTIPIPGDYRVALDCLEGKGEKVQIRGGEALRLWVRERSGDDPILEHRPYDEPKTSNPPDALAENPSAVGDQADPDYNPQAFLVAGHDAEPSRADPQGKRKGQYFALRVSIQNAVTTRFSPRPQWVWAEVTPLLRKTGQREMEAVAQSFVVCDGQFEAGHPVPLLRLDTGPWPERADGELFAELKLWFSLKDFDPQGQKALADLATPDESRFEAIPDGSPVTYRATIHSLPQNQVEVTVFEQHPNAPLEMPRYDARRVELSRPADEIRREYYPNIGLMKHVFVYRNTTRDEVAKAWLRVYRVEELKRKENGTAELAKSLIIPVGRRR